ncbi:hypothetical protein KJ966_00865 [bacterium]|nr:hypothetical protein [bacterium]
MDARNVKKIHVEMVAKDELNYRKLLVRRIHIFPNDPVVGYSKIRNNFAPETAKLFTHHPKALQSTSLNLIISKQSKNGGLFMGKFNAGLKKLKESDKYDQLLREVMSGKYDIKANKKND